MRIRVLLILISLLLALPFLMGSGCSGTNTKVTITFVNDQPSTTAHISIFHCGGIFAGSNVPLSTAIGADGRGVLVDDTGDTCPVTITQVTCGSGLSVTVPNPVLLPNSDSRRTIDCQFRVAIRNPKGWGSLRDSLRKVVRNDNPADNYPTDPPGDSGSEAARETAARDFLLQSDTHSTAAVGLYALLLGAQPPDSTVQQNLQAGLSPESQIVYVAGGQQFFAAASNNNSTFVTRLYQTLLARNPSSAELNSTVSLLNNGYQTFIEEPCPPPPCAVDGICMIEEPSTCGYYEWYPVSREDIAWEVVTSHEFHQVVARHMYGAALRRVATTSEIEDQAYYIGAHGIREGAVRLLKLAEFLNKSADPS